MADGLSPPARLRRWRLPGPVAPHPIFGGRWVKTRLPLRPELFDLVSAVATDAHTSDLKPTGRVVEGPSQSACGMA